MPPLPLQLLEFTHDCQLCKNKNHELINKLANQAEKILHNAKNVDNKKYIFRIKDQKRQPEKKQQNNITSLQNQLFYFEIFQTFSVTIKHCPDTHINITAPDIQCKASP